MPRQRLLMRPLRLLRPLRPLPLREALCLRGFLQTLVQSRLPKFYFVLGLARYAGECTLARSRAVCGVFK